MSIAAGLRRARAALSHWGVREYLVLAAVWLVLSIPLYLAGWGLASVLSLPLLLLLGAVLTYGASALLVTPAPRTVKPRPSFPNALEGSPLGEFPLSTYADTRYEKSIQWSGTQVRLSLSVETVDTIDAVTRAAVSITGASSRVNAEVCAFAAAELLPGINEERRAVGQSTLLPAEFLGTISLQMITIHHDGTYEFLYADGDLLGGHWIEVHGSLAEGPVEVDTLG